MAGRLDLSSSASDVEDTAVVAMAPKAVGRIRTWFLVSCLEFSMPDESGLRTSGRRGVQYVYVCIVMLKEEFEHRKRVRVHLVWVTHFVVISML